ncbi:hypothetical protein Q7L65_21430 [Conexibacter sp. CPCC 206217]|nr:hypothetical protein [Conexibacter sp. CPCC 206217]
MRVYSWDTGVYHTSGGGMRGRVEGAPALCVARRGKRMRARKARRHVAAAVVGIGLGVVAAGSPALAAGRAFELVTPVGSDPDVRLGGGAATPDGDIVCFNTERAIAGSTPNGLVTADDGFCSRRTPSGWTTTWVTGPTPVEPLGGRGGQVYFVSPDGSRVVFASDLGIYPDYRGAEPGQGTASGTLSAFMWDGGASPRWLAPTANPLPERRSPVEPAVSLEREAVAVSRDLSHGIFVSSLGLVPQDTNDTLDVYEWTPEGIRLVSRDQAGDAVGGFPALGTDAEQTLAEPGSVSADGSRIFFEHTGSSLAGSPAGVKSVFLREGDDLTLVSPRRGPGPAMDVTFAGATEDGSTVYLTTEEQLTNDAKRAGAALYSYDVASDQLTLLATDDSDTGVYFLGSSADGSTVVYRSGLAQLFVLRDGQARSLGNLDFTDTVPLLDSGASSRSDKRAMRISADGSVIVFASTAALDDSPGGVRQIFRWTPAEGLRRISRDAADTPPVTAAGFGNYSTVLPGFTRQSTLNTMRFRPNLGRGMSDDGSRVFFETADPLVDSDINGFIDVYEWHNGTVSLVSPGTQRADAFYHDNSADGTTVFFTTEAQIIPESDRNTSRDLYAAREGGGFALPEPAPRCEGDVCQGSVTAPPVSTLPSSSTFEGPGDTTDPAPLVPRHTVARLTAAQRGVFARRGRTVLRVRANEKGIVTATVTARIGRRTVVVARSMRVARSGSTASLPLTLSRRARTVLRTKRRLRLVISVSYSESETTIRQVVVLRG